MSKEKPIFYGGYTCHTDGKLHDFQKSEEHFIRDTKVCVKCGRHEIDCEPAPIFKLFV